MASTQPICTEGEPSRHQLETELSAEVAGRRAEPLRLRLVAEPGPAGVYVVICCAAADTSPATAGHRRDPRRWWAIITGRTAAPKWWPAFASRVVAFGTARKVTLLPAWVDQAGWNKLTQTPQPPPGADQLAPSPGGATSMAGGALVEAVQGGPRKARRLLLRELQQQQRLLAYLRRQAPLSYGLRVELALASWHRCWNLFCAWQGLPFDGSARCRPALADLVRPPGGVQVAALDQYFIARGRAWTLGRTVGRRRDRSAWLQTAAELAAFLRSFRRQVWDHYTTPRQRRWRDLWRRLLPVALVGLLVAAVTLALTRGVPLEPLADESVITSPGGIRAQFFRGLNFDQEVHSTVVPQINFRRLRPQLRQVPAGKVTMRWQGYLRLPEGGRFRLCTQHDDGARVWLRDQLVVDDWKRGTTRQACRVIRGRPGWYPVKVEYFNYEGWAEMRLLRGPELRLVDVPVVPPADLCCTEPRAPVSRAAARQPRAAGGRRNRRQRPASRRGVPLASKQGRPAGRRQPGESRPAGASTTQGVKTR